MSFENLQDLDNTNTIVYYLSKVPEFSNFVLNEKMEDINNLQLNKLTCHSSNNQEYKVIRYDKNFLSSNYFETYGLIRSVILNKNNNVVVFSPPKSICPEDFITKNSDLNDIIAEEFVEGTMINVFWDPNIGLSGGWEISTRNTVSATSGFYKSVNSKTFRTMFLEAAEVNHLDLQKLNPKYCYSFVMQHPENRIVVPFKELKLYLIAIYFIDNSDKNDIRVYSFDIDKIKQDDWRDAIVHFPKKYTFTTYQEVIEKYASMNTSYDILGVVFRNKITGLRTKIRNPVYESVRNLRGNQPKLQYQYLCLRNEGKVKDFLNFYSEHKKEFSVFRDQLHLFTETLYNNYKSCYIKKEQPLICFPDQYRTHMFNIHKIFLDELREQKKIITIQFVMQYVNKLHPSLLMYCLNFNMRKQKIDYSIADNQI